MIKKIGTEARKDIEKICRAKNIFGTVRKSAA
jgi:GTPase Era involved in 16S rRNA processing